MNFFDFEGGNRTTNEKFHSLFGLAPRREGDKLIQKHADLAASIQAVTEELVLSFATFARSVASSDNLVYAGGVALNCVANTVLEKFSPFKRIFIQPAAGDAGGSLGAAYLGYHLKKADVARRITVGTELNYVRASNSSFPARGLEYSNTEVEKALKKFGLKSIILNDYNLLQVMIEAVANNQTIGVFRGKSEFGPRALGNRSIIANATKPGNILKLNEAIKYREGFRPFAPMLLRSEFEKYYEADSKYTNKDSMLFVAYLKEEYRGEIIQLNYDETSILRPLETKSIFPAVVHLDYSSRVQVVEDESGDFTSCFLRGLKHLTGYGIAVNTSFNLRGEPNVEKPTDAISTFLRSRMEFLILNNHLIKKSSTNELTSYGSIHDPD
jgi:carbamoyltransferase